MFQCDKWTLTGTLCTFSHRAQLTSAQEAQLAKEAWLMRRKSNETKQRYKEAYKQLLDDIEGGKSREDQEDRIFIEYYSHRFSHPLGQG